MADKLSDKVDIVDISSVPDEGDGKSANDIRAELALLVAKVDKERKRLEFLLGGCGRGRGKSAEFEFAARSILASGCSARAARTGDILFYVYYRAKNGESSGTQ